MSEMLKSLTIPKAILLAVGAVAVMSLFVLAIGCVSVTASNRDRVIMGVQAEGETIAGLTYEETRKYFQQTAEQKLGKKAVVLEYQQKTWDIMPEDIKLEGKIDEAARAAYSIGRDEQAGALANLITQLRCAMFGQSVKMDAEYDKELLNEKLAAIQKEINRQPVNATCDFGANGGLAKTKAQIGLKLDIEPIKEQLDEPFRKMKLTQQIALEPEIIQPFIRDEDLASMDSVLASYTTNYYPGDRGDNIELAASQFYGYILKPGLEFSFNAVVGERTKARGFKDAGVIIEGKHEIDSGGGVCQVSSTLYNAILLAGLTPTQRAAHYYRSSYCPPGMDATVADGVLDFKFRNDLKHPICLLTGSTGSALTIYVLGTYADLQGNDISLTSDGDSQNPSIYRVWSKNGQVIENEFMHTDHYDVDTGA